MKGGYYLDVRASDPPHEVLGQVQVPYAAAIGKMPIVCVEERGSWAAATFKRHHFDVRVFEVRGSRLVAIPMSRERLGELEDKIAAPAGGEG